MQTLVKFIVVLVAAAVVAGVGFIAAHWAPDKPLAELKARWAQQPSQFIQVQGMDVHVRDEGPRDDASPIILMHGFGSSLHAWDGWAQTLKARHRVIRFDLPGFGLTGPSPDRRYGIDRDIAVLTGVMDALGVQRGVIGGNSLGGAVAWRAALHHPDRVDKLILVDAGGYGTGSQSAPIGFLLLGIPGINWLLQNTLPVFLVEQGYRNVFGKPDRVTPEMIERAVDLTRREGNRGALVDRAMQRQRGGTEAARIPEIKVPTLIMWGARDHLIPLEDAQRFQRDIAGSQLVVYDDLGHAPEEEDPARTVIAVQQFLGTQ